MNYSTERMSERLVEIAVDRTVRDQIKNAKKDMTYSQYLQKKLELS